jgi:hypothetical protein
MVVDLPASAALGLCFNEHIEEARPDGHRRAILRNLIWFLFGSIGAGRPLPPVIKPPSI